MLLWRELVAALAGGTIAPIFRHGYARRRREAWTLMIEQAEGLALALVSLPVLTAHRVGIVDRG